MFADIDFVEHGKAIVVTRAGRRIASIAPAPPRTAQR
jgi:antitoxin (DNA-binding transcriptional repressor) of toxin-antitoxin stability system